MIMIIVLIVAAVIAAVVVYAATGPDTFRVERAASINAPPEKIFPLINDFRQWEAWSPWEKIDPAVRRTYSGPGEGTGAVYEWSGNRNIGQGRLEIIESSPPSKAVFRIDFIKPIAAQNTVEFTLARQGDTTTVTQAMYGPRPLVSKVMGLLCSMDKMIGEKYEEGLAALKSLAEK